MFQISISGNLIVLFLPNVLFLLLLIFYYYYSIKLFLCFLLQNFSMPLKMNSNEIGEILPEHFVHCKENSIAECDRYISIQFSLETASILSDTYY